MLALVTRILLLCSIFLLTKMTKPLFVMPLVGHGVSGKDLVLISGGLFLIWKSTHEIHGSLEGEDHELSSQGARRPSAAVVTQIILIDIVFSLDSVITAVGMAQHIGVMITAVILAMIVMLLASKSISDFVNQRPTIKMLALSFLLLIGVVLVADGFGQHVPKGYIYFAMAFSFGVELLNLRLRRKSATHVELRKKV